MQCWSKKSKVSVPDLLGDLRLFLFTNRLKLRRNDRLGAAQYSQTSKVSVPDEPAALVNQNS